MSIRTNFGNRTSPVALYERAIALHQRQKHIEPQSETDGSSTPLAIAAVEHVHQSLHGKKPKPFTALVP